VGTSFLPETAKLYWVLYVIQMWAITLYVFAADLVMILRLWAMYNRSKIILGIVLTSYLGEIVVSTIASIIYSMPYRNIIVTVNSLKAADLFQLVHAGVMCALLMIQFTIRSVEMYRATKQWRLGRFVNLLVVEGMTYFFAMLTWNLIYTLDVFGTFSAVDQKQWVPPSFVENMPIFLLTSRFVLNIREMDARSTIHVGGEHGIDTGFGLSALASHELNCSSILFADGGEIEGLGDDREDIQMERRTS